MSGSVVVVINHPVLKQLLQWSHNWTVQDKLCAGGGFGKYADIEAPENNKKS
jgi:hypothetical protein